MRKESSASSDDEVLVDLIAKMREKKLNEARNISGRVKAIEKKTVFPQRSVNLGGGALNTGGMSKAAFQKALKESRKKKKEKQEFSLVDELDMEEVDLVSKGDDKEEEEFLFEGKERKRLNHL